MANVIAQVQRPTLILAHNKTLAAQLYQEFKAFFPENAVEYFVSYYDYYQPEAYIARTDTYIEKDMAINDQIDRMRLSGHPLAHRTRRCDHRLFRLLHLRLGHSRILQPDAADVKNRRDRRRDEVLLHLVQMHYTRSDYELVRKTFRVRGDVLEVMPAYEEDLAYRIEFFGDEIERISAIDPLTGRVKDRKRTDLDLSRISPRHTCRCPLESASEPFKKSSKKDPTILKKKKNISNINGSTKEPNKI